MHVTTHGHLIANNWKRFNVQVAALALGLSFAGGVVLGGGLLTEKDSARSAPSTVSGQSATDVKDVSAPLDSQLDIALAAARAVAGSETIPQELLAQFDTKLVESSPPAFPVRQASEADIAAGVLSSELASFTYFDVPAYRASSTHQVSDSDLAAGVLSTERAHFLDATLVAP